MTVVYWGTGVGGTGANVMGVAYKHLSRKFPSSFRHGFRFGAVRVGGVAVSNRPYFPGRPRVP